MSNESRHACQAVAPARCRERADDNDHERWRAPDREQDKADERNAKIAGRSHRACPHRMIERGSEQADDRGIDAAHHRLCSRAAAEGFPERQGADEDQNAGQENADKPDCRARQRLQRAGDSAKIAGEGEKRTGNRLRRAVTGKEDIVAEPAGRHEGLRNNGSTTWPPPNTSAPDR